MLKSPLVVGKLYRTRDGKTIQIYDKTFLTTHPYHGTNGRSYRHNGSAGFFKETPDDIVEEVGDASQSAFDALIAAVERLDA